MAGRKQKKQAQKRAKKQTAHQKKKKRIDMSDDAYRKFMAGIPRPKGKFNKWGEKKWITATEEQIRESEELMRALKLSKRARCLFEAAYFSKSQGIEFVFMSNAQLIDHVVFKNGIQIVPCFYPVNFYNPSTVVDDAKHSAMSKAGNFIYDGWKPIREWTRENLEGIVSELDEASKPVFDCRNISCTLGDKI